MQKDFFKGLLLNRKEEILKILNSLSKKEINKCDIKDDLNFASFSLERDTDFKIYERYKKELEEIDKALKKIEEDRYGICEMCEEEIEEERLKLKPHAKYCIICKEIEEREKTGK